MKTRRALRNPTVDSNPVDYGKLSEASQLGFGVATNEEKIQQTIGTVKTRLKKRRDFILVSKIWKTPAIPFFIVTSVFNLLLLLIGGIFFYDQLNPEIPLFYNSIDQLREVTTKGVIFIISVLFLLLFIVEMQLLSETFKKDRKMSLTNAWIMTLLNILFMISIVKLA